MGLHVRVDPESFSPKVYVKNFVTKMPYFNVSRQKIHILNVSRQKENEERKRGKRKRMRKEKEEEKGKEKEERERGKE